MPNWGAKTNTTRYSFVLSIMIQLKSIPTKTYATVPSSGLFHSEGLRYAVPLNSMLINSEWSKCIN